MRAIHEVQVINWFLTPQPPMLHLGGTGKDQGSRDIILVSSPPLVYTNVIFVSLSTSTLSVFCVWQMTGFTKDCKKQQQHYT